MQCLIDTVYDVMALQRVFCEIIKFVKVENEWMKEPKRIWDDNASAVTPCNTSEYLIQTIFHCSVISFAILCQFEHFWNIWPSAVGGKLPLCKQEFGMKMLLLLNCQTLNKSAVSAQTLQKRCWVSVPLWMAHRSRRVTTSTLSAVSGLWPFLEDTPVFPLYLFLYL